ncbi:hypothetical protein OBCHQ24_12520 [Oceanobacillus iheyensis]|nr:hypothetical protein OBCHQ24_12520 [Oceanobacillus iheyensis]
MELESIKVDLQDGKMDVTVKSVKIAIEDITKVIEEQAFVDITPEKKAYQTKPNMLQVGTNKTSKANL